MHKCIAAVLSVLVLTSSIKNVYAAGSGNETVFDRSGLDSGIIGISFKSTSNKKYKVMVEKDGSTIYYNLRSDGKAESFPLQLGNGLYSVSIMENIEGSSYKYVLTEVADIALDDPSRVFLASVQNINWNNNMAAIRKAAELARGRKHGLEVAEAVYDYVINNIKYDYNKAGTVPGNYVPDIEDVFESKSGICYDFASIFAAMLRSNGIPAKLVKGYLKGAKGYHAWNEVYNSEKGSWLTIDTCVDSQLKAAGMECSMIKDCSLYTKIYEY